MFGLDQVVHPHTREDAEDHRRENHPARPQRCEHREGAEKDDDSRKKAKAAEGFECFHVGLLLARLGRKSLLFRLYSTNNPKVPRGEGRCPAHIPARSFDFVPLRASIFRHGIGGTEINMENQFITSFFALRFTIRVP